MVRVVDFSVPVSDFILDAAFDVHPRMLAAFTPIVPTGTDIFPYLHVFEDHDSATQRALDDERYIESHERLFETDRSTMYAVEWVRGAGLFETLLGSEAVVLSAKGTADGWTFRAGFDPVSRLEDFEELAARHKLDLEIAMVTEEVPMFTSSLSPDQQTTLRLAVDRGYFDVPRKITEQELARELGVSSQAISQRIRRAVKNLVQSQLYGYRRVGNEFTE